MRKISFLLLAVVVLASCSKSGYKISGTITGNTIPPKVYIKVIDGLNTPAAIDSAEVRDGKFTLKGSLDHPEFVFIQLSNDIQFPMILENGEVTLTASMDKPELFKITGTPGNELLAKYKLETKGYSVKLDSIYKSYVNAQVAGKLTSQLDSSIKKAYDDQMAIRNVFVEKFIKEHNTNLVAAAILIQEQMAFSDDKKQELLNALSPELADAGIVKAMKKDADTRKASAVGQPFIDFKLADPNGAEQLLSSYTKNAKVVLLDFWASWCGPCRHENPNVVKMYAKLKDKGLTIVGVSLDDTKDKWLEAIKADNITWAQLSDLKGWKSSAAALYGVKAIPATFLISGGKIVAKDLRGSELEAKIEELLK